MQFSTVLLLSISAAIGLTAAMPATPTDPNLHQCGSANYYKNEYTCYDNKALCPIKGGVTYQNCAGAGCFDPAVYHCTNGHLAHN